MHACMDVEDSDKWLVGECIPELAGGDEHSVAGRGLQNGLDPKADDRIGAALFIPYYLRASAGAT